MSRCLSDRSIDHVVLERGEIAHSWRTERWDSLRLLTPNWQSRLPGYGYSGDDPDGKEVEDDTDRKSPRGAARYRCSSHRGSQPLSPNIGEHARRCAEGIGEVRWIGRTLRGEFGLHTALRRQLIDQRARRNLAEHL